LFNIFDISKFDNIKNAVIALNNFNFSAAACFAIDFFYHQKQSNNNYIDSNNSFIFLAPTIEFAERFIFETQYFIPEKYILPIIPIKQFENKIIESLTDLSVTNCQKIILITPETFYNKYPDIADIKKQTLTLKKGADYQREKLLEFLITQGYTREDIVRIPKTFSARGGIIDIFLEHHERPIRLDFFDDTIAALRWFDEKSQRSIEDCVEINILPNLSKLTQSQSILDLYQKKNINTLIVYEPILCAKNNENIQTTLKNECSNFLQLHLMLLRDDSYNNIIDYKLNPNIIFKEQGIIKNLNYLLTNNYNIILTAQYENQINRITKICETADLKFEILENKKTINLNISNQIESKKIYILQSNLTDAFALETSLKIIIAPEQSFTVSNLIRNKSFLIETETIPYSHFSELKPNDYVVHIDYGIGIYKHIETIEVDNKKEDFILIQYADNGQLFLPIDKLDKIQKYIGSGDSRPPLYKLGGNAWQKIKLKAKKHIGAIARELVELYARRELAQGIRMAPDTPWQLEFESEFAWEETRAQLRAISEIKRDLESGKTMDRLLCGDVGYGKTEVALRAAFKCLMNNYQVAILTPTTILTHQHYLTFSDRLRRYPFKIEMLSRFKTPKEQKQILNRLAQGDIDIIIGTHRLLQNDVKFKNLALLIIDEEQRFGVKHKEKIKQMRNNIHILSMTATPIPRTLHLSLTGIRDISIIDTPPKGRLPVQVFVSEDTDEIIQKAILTELSRKGQVYYIHNRIETINSIQTRIQRLAPQARTVILHGQMRTDDIENIMYDFIQHKYDVLISTTIIENGLDIPNVNTLIVSDCDKFGLAQLYQIKGRIGRTTLTAFAYFLHKGQAALNADAKKRLAAITMHTELGAGFKIAMEDLEIRGAGNIIGLEQHGVIVDIGYELYCKLLAEMIKYLQKNKQLPLTDNFEFSNNKPLIRLFESAYINDDYIKDSTVKIELYKKLSICENIEDLENIKNETIDRFGNLPTVVNNLFIAVKLRILAEQYNLSEISINEDKIKLKTNQLPNLLFDKIRLKHIPIEKSIDPNIIFILPPKTLKTVIDKSEYLFEIGVRRL